MENAGLSSELFPRRSSESARATESAKAMESLTARAESEIMLVESPITCSAAGFSFIFFRLDLRSSWDETLNELIIRKKIAPNISFSIVICLFRKFFIILQDAKVILISKIAKHRIF